MVGIYMMEMLTFDYTVESVLLSSEVQLDDNQCFMFHFTIEKFYRNHYKILLVYEDENGIENVLSEVKFTTEVQNIVYHTQEIPSGKGKMKIIARGKNVVLQLHEVFNHCQGIYHYFV